MLALYGTGRLTLLPESDLEEPPVANDSSHSRFANLLDIDAPSWPRTWSNGCETRQPSPTDYFFDAAFFAAGFFAAAGTSAFLGAFFLGAAAFVAATSSGSGSVADLRVAGGLSF